MFKNIKNKGFTLIEIMVVIAILGVLVAIGLPNLINYRDKAYCSAAEVDARAVAAAIAEYFVVASRTALPVAGDLDLTRLSNGNTYLLQSSDPEILITIMIVTTDRCPKSYQLAALRPDTKSTGWDGIGIYYFVIKR